MNHQNIVRSRRSTDRRWISPRDWHTAVTLLLAGVLGFASSALGGYTVTRLTPNFNPGSQPHLVNTALHLPVDVDVAPGNGDYFFVSQLGGLGSDAFDGDDITKAEGRIVLLDRNSGSVNFTTPFLTIGDTNLFDPVPGAPEVGLLSTAFHPNFATNGKFYVSVAVNYPGPAPSLAPRDPRTPPFKLAVREYTADPNNILAGATFSKTIFELDQPAFNHNGSWLGFNPIEAAQGQNYLYVTLGDGGDQHDPYQYGQDKEHLLGTVMRIDIDGDDFADPNVNYAIPNDNPFVGASGLDEIWAYGFRNPWRAGFDSQTGDLFIGDVGQFAWEEIHYFPADITPADDRNAGWRLREGFIATPTGPGGSTVGGRAPADNVDPIIAYAHGNGDYQGNSVVGGIVYRGPVEEFYGMYIFADSLSGNIWGMDVNDIGTFDVNNPGDSLVLLTDALAPADGSYVSIVSFAEDEQGNLLIVDHGYDGAGLGGHIYRLDFVLSGDYNHDGVVNIADYTVWRDHVGAPAGTLPNDTDGGLIGPNQYSTWKANFHESFPQPATTSQVPEAPALVHWLGAFVFALIRYRPRWLATLGGVALLASANVAHAISAGQVDDFQDGTVAGWGPGFANVAFNVMDAGPTGDGDHALVVTTANATGRIGSRLISVNNSQWSGNWTAAEIAAIEFDAFNPNDFDLVLWLGVAGPNPPGSSGTGEAYVSLSPATLVAGSGWNRYSIPVTPENFEEASNHSFGTIESTLTSVAQMRIFHNITGRIAPNLPNNFIGDVIDAEFYLDNIRAVPVPEPSSVLVVLLLGSGCWLVPRVIPRRYFRNLPPADM